MPMSWTPENDRLLLLKLIETHGISVDSKKIVAAWPDGGQKPSTRAITERFVKLRQLAGIKVSITPGGKGRPRASKYTTPRKRKNKADSSDESDAEEHLTENESPTKKQLVQRDAGGSGLGSARGVRRGCGSMQNASIRIKSEYPLSELPIDPLNGEDSFERDAAEAAEIRQSSQENPLAGFTAGGFNGGFQGFGSSNGHIGMDGFGMSDGAAFNNGFASPGMILDDPFTTSNHPSHGFTNSMQAFDNGMQSAAAAGINGRTKMYLGRSRPGRMASAQASEGVAAALRRQKDQDEADGERSSGEDSQASEYHDMEGDYV